MDIPMPPVLQPRSMADYMKEYADAQGSVQQNQMNAMKLQRAPQEFAMKDRADQLAIDEGETKQQSQKLMYASGMAKAVLSQSNAQAKAKGIPEGTPEYEQIVNQVGHYYAPRLSEVFGEKYDPAKLIDINAVRTLAAYDSEPKHSQADIDYKVAEKKALLPYEQQNYTPVQTPGGETQWYNAKNPQAGPLPTNNQPVSNQAQPVAPATNGLTNIFATQPTSDQSPRTQQLAEEQAIRNKGEEYKLKLEQTNLQTKADQALFNDEPNQIDKISGAANNLAGLGKNLDEYGKQVKSELGLTDNNIAYNARVLLGNNTVLNDITQANGQIMVEAIKSMKADSGVSPTQLMNTEKEWERQLAAATGTGTAESRKNAWKKLTTELHQTYNQYEQRRAKAYERQNKPYKPLMSDDVLPGNKILSVDTGNKPIGSTGVMNGKTIKVIGPNQIEVVD